MFNGTTPAIGELHGVVLGLASSGLHYDPRPWQVSVAAAFGNFQATSGIAAGLGYAGTRRQSAPQAPQPQAPKAFTVRGAHQAARATAVPEAMKCRLA